MAVDRYESRSREELPLNCDRDPVRWADEFLKGVEVRCDSEEVLTGKEPLLDKGWLIGWFANTFEGRTGCSFRSHVGTIRAANTMLENGDLREWLRENARYYIDGCAVVQIESLEPLFTQSATAPTIYECRTCRAKILNPVDRKAEQS